MDETESGRLTGGLTNRLELLDNIFPADLSMRDTLLGEGTPDAEGQKYPYQFHSDGRVGAKMGQCLRLNLDEIVCKLKQYCGQSNRSTSTSSIKLPQLQTSGSLVYTLIGDLYCYPIFADGSPKNHSTAAAPRSWDRRGPQARTCARASPKDPRSP